MRADPGPPPQGGAHRLDALLVERGLARSRGEAQAFVAAGRVRVDGTVVDKPGRRVAGSAHLEVDYPAQRYASRGGLKLEKALSHFGLDVNGLVCLDVGASTGGFTDCLLRHGARRVYAVDVGYGLLAWSLRTDPRVVVLDRTNARYLTRESFRQAVERQGREILWPSFATCDVSFISLLKVVPAVVSLLEDSWQMVLLVKPQFEAGRDKVGSRGVVRDPEVHEEVLVRLIDGLTVPGREKGMAAPGGEAAREVAVKGVTFSPVRGPEGNVEYLLWVAGGSAEPGVAGPVDARREAREAVRQAQASFGRE